MPPSTQKPSEQDEIGSRISETILDVAIDKIADLLDSHRALQPLWKAVVLGADAVEALHHHITAPLRTDVAYTAGFLCFGLILPMISLSLLLLGSFEDGYSALRYCQCAVLPLALSVTFALHSTVGLVDGVSFAGLLWNTDNTRAGRKPATSETRASGSTDGNKSCSSVQDAPRPEAELRGTGVGKDSDTTSTATPTSNLTTILQENLLIAQNNIKLLQLARSKDLNFYNAEMASMTAAHEAQTADLTGKLSKMNAAHAQMHTTSQQQLNEVTTKLSKAEKQLEEKSKALDTTRSFWEADTISKRNALKEKTLLLEKLTTHLHTTEKTLQHLTDSTARKEATFASQHSNLHHAFKTLESELHSAHTTLHTTQTHLHHARKDSWVLAAQLETSAKEIQNLYQQRQTLEKISEAEGKRIGTLRNLCEFWHDLAMRERDARVRLREQVGLARAGFEEIGGEEVEGVRREMMGLMEEEEGEGGDGDEGGWESDEDGIEVDKIENVDEDWDEDEDEDEDEDKDEDKDKDGIEVEKIENIDEDWERA
ncbi:hypothetical protein AC578_2359 [Pseudocercospora eumusae]|uniref:Uncharacterized protein n=1 Tax=Pseudocercospora eumusae TaxID=321146 RepID=A0A139HXP5_9PEZI|nr:hypothetical protein AC578_2359 [Pseudocercospora eumusae]